MTKAQYGIIKNQINASADRFEMITPIRIWETLKDLCPPVPDYCFNQLEDCWRCFPPFIHTDDVEKLRSATLFSLFIGIDLIALSHLARYMKSTLVNSRVLCKLYGLKKLALSLYAAAQCNATVEWDTIQRQHTLQWRITWARTSIVI